MIRKYFTTSTAMCYLEAPQDISFQSLTLIRQKKYLQKIMLYQFYIYKKILISLFQSSNIIRVNNNVITEKIEVSLQFNSTGCCLCCKYRESQKTVDICYDTNFDLNQICYIIRKSIRMAKQQ